MIVSVKSGITLNVGENTSIAANPIHYDVDTAEPVNPQIGDFRFVPNQVASAVSAQIQWYDPDVKDWVSEVPTIFDIYLARELKDTPNVDPDSVVYYKLIQQDTTSEDITEVTVIENNGSKGE